jgi:large subunit ribosomal protein L14e
MYEIGRLCVKIAGRDAGKKCLVVDILENGFVMIDGQTRRKRCNTKHLEPLDKVLKIKKEEGTSEVAMHLKKEGIEVEAKVAKEKKAKPAKVSSKSTKVEKAEKPKKITVKKKAVKE